MEAWCVGGLWTQHVHTVCHSCKVNYTINTAMQIYTKGQRSTSIHGSSTFSSKHHTWLQKKKKQDGDGQNAELEASKRPSTKQWGTPQRLRPCLLYSLWRKQAFVCLSWPPTGVHHPR